MPTDWGPAKWGKGPCQLGFSHRAGKRASWWAVVRTHTSRVLSPAAEVKVTCSLLAVLVWRCTSWKSFHSVLPRLTVRIQKHKPEFICLHMRERVYMCTRAQRWILSNVYPRLMPFTAWDRLQPPLLTPPQPEAAPKKLILTHPYAPSLEMLLKIVNASFKGMKSARGVC